VSFYLHLPIFVNKYSQIARAYRLARPEVHYTELLLCQQKGRAYGWVVLQTVMTCPLKLHASIAGARFGSRHYRWALFWFPHASFRFMRTTVALWRPKFESTLLRITHVQRAPLNQSRAGCTFLVDTTKNHSASLLVQITWEPLWQGPSSKRKIERRSLKIDAFNEKTNRTGLVSVKSWLGKTESVISVRDFVLPLYMLNGVVV
jgi:hypothetical protein